MMRCALVVLVLALACGDDDGMIGPDAGPDSPDAAVDTGVDAVVDTGLDAPVDGDIDAGPVPECPAGDGLLDALGGEPAFAVLGSDFTSTSIAVLDAQGDVLNNAWFDSSATAPGLVAALGGDVVLVAPIAGTFGVLDRFGVDVATRVCLDGTLIGQVRLGPSDGFRSNAHDWIAVQPDRGWATRYDRNPTAGAPPEAAGNDLIGFDPRTMTLNGERIDLSAFDATVSGLSPAGAVMDVDVTARADRLVRVAGHVVVGLDRLPADLFGVVRGHGEGTVVMVADDGTVTSHELTDLANCGHVQVVAGTTDEVLVSCAGYSDVGFGEPSGERATAGLVRLRIAAGVATEVSARRVADAGGAMAVRSAVSLGGDRVVAVAAGDFAEVPDVLYLMDLSDDSQTMVAEGGESFVLGEGAYDGAQLLLVPDASTGTAEVRRFDVTSSGVTEGAPVVVGPAALPPRAIRIL